MIGGQSPKWGQPGAESDPCPTPPGATDEGCVISTRLMKLTLTGNLVTAQQPLVDGWCQQFPSHSAGGLVFGPEGMLYASGGEGASFEDLTYEIYAPHGVALLVELSTDNRNRTAAEIRSIVTKNGGTIATAGSVARS